MPRVGLVVVSHSHALAEAAVALAREMLAGQQVDIGIAAGLDDDTFGTDAAAIAEAVAAADSGDGVVVLMDLGSAVLSAELALEFLDEEIRNRVVLCPAALVEGLVGAAVTAGGGAGRDAVAAEALAGLAAKTAHLSGVAAAGPVQQPDDEPVTGSRPVAGAHGLHARPAAQLVQLAGSLDARLEVRNATTGTAWVPATSLSAVAALGVQQGHELAVRASGAGAAAAVAALLTLVGPDAPAGGTAPAGGRAPSGEAAPFGKSPPAAGAASSDPAGPAQPDPPSGDVPPPGSAVPASPGVGIGPAWQLPDGRPEVPAEPAGDPDAERARLDAARDRCREAIRRTRDTAATSVGESAAAVFDAHLAFLDDPSLLTEARSGIDAGQPAAAAWLTAVDQVHDVLAGLADPYLRARAADVLAVGDQVLAALTGAPPPDDALGEASGVVVAEDLAPAQAIGLDPARIAGVVLAAGSPTSHSVMLLRARGVPAVVTAGREVRNIPGGTLVAVDGATGELAVDPPPEVLTGFRTRIPGSVDPGR